MSIKHLVVPLCVALAFAVAAATDLPVGQRRQYHRRCRYFR